MRVSHSKLDFFYELLAPTSMTPAGYFKGVFKQLHRLGIPLHDGLTLVAEVAEQRGAGGTIAEDSIFHDRLA